MDTQWSDTIGIVAWLGGFAIVLGVLIVAGNLFLAWLVKHPKAGRLFAIVFSGFAFAVATGIVAFFVTFFGYGYHRSRQIWGIDIVPFSTASAAIGGFLIGVGIAFYVTRWLARRK